MKFSRAIEDKEDFAQEERIRLWLASQSIENSGIEFNYTSKKGTPKHSRVRASLSLDQKIVEGEDGTFQEIIPGVDGRDIFDQMEPEPLRDPNAIMLAMLGAMGMERKLSVWVVTTLKSSMNQKPKHFGKSAIDLEW